MRKLASNIRRKDFFQSMIVMFLQNVSLFIAMHEQAKAEFISPGKLQSSLAVPCSLFLIRSSEQNHHGDSTGGC